MMLVCLQWPLACAAMHSMTELHLWPGLSHPPDHNPTSTIVTVISFDLREQELETMALRVMEAQQATQARLDARGEQMAGVSAEYERKKVEVRRSKRTLQADRGHSSTT